MRKRNKILSLKTESLNLLSKPTMIELPNINSERKKRPFKQQEDYPLALSVMDVAEIMRIGRSKAYSIVKEEDFPRIDVGSRIIIPRNAFFQWLEERAFSKTPRHSS